MDTKSLVTAAAALDRDIAEKQKQLTELKARLVELAEKQLRRELELGPRASLEGRSAQLDGEEVYARVSFPKPRLPAQLSYLQGKAYIKRDEELVQLTHDPKEFCGPAFPKLFAMVYKPARAFRELVGALLPEAKAKTLLQELESPSSPRVAFETKEAAKCE